MKLFSLLVGGAALTMGCATAASAAEGSAQDGGRKNSMCIGCHGIPNYRTAFPHTYSVPKLGGQSAQYIAGALQQYKSGARKNSTMHAIAASLSEQDMADLAAYYAAQGSAQPAP